MDLQKVNTIVSALLKCSEDISILNLSMSTQAILNCVIGSDITNQKLWKSVPRQLISTSSNTIEANQQEEFQNLKSKLTVYPENDVLVTLIDDFNNEKPVAKFAFFASIVTKNAFLTGLFKISLIDGSNDVPDFDIQPFVFARNLSVESRDHLTINDETFGQTKSIQTKKIGLTAKISNRLSVKREMTDVNARINDKSYNEFASYVTQEFDEKTNFQHKEIQSVNSVRDNECQTIRSIRKNTWIQYEPRILNTSDIKSVENSDEFREFLKTFSKIVEAELDKNIFDLFRDDFKLAPKEVENTEEPSSEKIQVTEFINAHQLNNGMRMENLVWSPFDEEIILTSSLDNGSIEEQLLKYSQNQLRIKCVLLWNLNFPEKTKAILEASSNLSIVQFLDSHRDIIICGGIYGEIFVFDLAPHWNSIKGLSTEDGFKKGVPTRNIKEVIKSGLVIQPCLTTEVTNFKHDRIVNMFTVDKITTDKDVPEGSRLKNESPLVLTVRADGVVLGWPLDNLVQWIKQKRLTLEETEFHWNPIFSTKISYGIRRKLLVSSTCYFKGKTPNMMEKLYIGLESGELLVTKMVHQRDESEKLNYYTDAYSLEVRLDGPIVDTKLNYGLTKLAIIGGGHLVILDTVNDVPIISSSFVETSILKLCWSLRESRLYLGRSDGFLEVWDYTRALYQPILRRKMNEFGIAAIALKIFENEGNNYDTLTLGDTESNIIQIRSEWEKYPGTPT